MPPWTRNQWPTTKQLEVSIYLWEKQRKWKPLAEDPGIDVIGQASFWLDPQVLDDNARIAECLRGGRPDRARFIRRIAATYAAAYVVRVSRTNPSPAIPGPRPVIAPPAARQIAQPPRAVAPKPLAGAAQRLSPTEVNDISRRQGLGICWQLGNSYRIGRNTLAKSCLVQFDANGRELARYGSW